MITFNIRYLGDVEGKQNLNSCLWEGVEFCLFIGFKVVLKYTRSTLIISLKIRNI